MAILLGESIVPAKCPIPIYGEAWLAGVQRKVPAGRVQVTRVAGVVVVESVLLWSSEVATARRFGDASSLMGAWRALFTQGVGTCYRNVVELLQQAVNGCIFGWPVPSNNGLQAKQTHET